MYTEEPVNLSNTIDYNTISDEEQKIMDLFDKQKVKKVKAILSENIFGIEENNEYDIIKYTYDKKNKKTFAYFINDKNVELGIPTLLMCKFFIPVEYFFIPNKFIIFVSTLKKYFYENIYCKK